MIVWALPSSNSFKSPVVRDVTGVPALSMTLSHVPTTLAAPGPCASTFCLKDDARGRSISSAVTDSPKRKILFQLRETLVPSTVRPFYVLGAVEREDNPAFVHKNARLAFGPTWQALPQLGNLGENYARKVSE